MRPPSVPVRPTVADDLCELGPKAKTVEDNSERMKMNPHAIRRKHAWQSPEESPAAS
jgi:hypothetical protein